MTYVVSGIKLIPQSNYMTCWYASAQMLIRWKHGQPKAVDENTIDPSKDWFSVILRDIPNQEAREGGIQNSQILFLAKQLGLAPVPPLTPTKEAIEMYLRKYGPLWVNGKTHIVVLAGIVDESLLIYDPSPMNKGEIRFELLDGWYTNGLQRRDNKIEDRGFRDVGSDVQAIFLHCPT